LATLGTFATGINASGQIVGFYENATGRHGFLLNGSTYTTLDDPLATNSTVATGINDLGQIVGYYSDSFGFLHGLLYNSGIFTPLSDPGFIGPRAFGINNAAHIVGTVPESGGVTRGFLETSVPNTPPPAGTTADMILRGSNTSPTAMGQYEIYDIGSNSILAAYSLGQGGTDWQFVGLRGLHWAPITR